MSPATMRRLDYWVGVPTCFLLTIADRLRRLFGRSGERSTAPPRRILFVQLAEMGTMVVAIPALRKAQELFPAAELHLLCFTAIRSSAQLIGVFDPKNIVTIDSSTLPSVLRTTLRFLVRARREPFDTVVNLETFVRLSTALGYLIGAGTRVGFHRFNLEGVYTGDLLTHRVLYNSHVHAGHTLLDLVYALVTPDGQVPHVKRSIAGERLTIPTMALDPAVTRTVWRTLQQASTAIDPSSTIVVLNPNGSERFPMRKLPLDSYATLAERLVKDPSVVVVVTGVASERADAQHICARANSARVIDLTGRTTLRELLHLFAIARAVITNDSGPAHFACLTHTHVVVFFGPEEPNRYRPLTERCDVVSNGFSCSPCVGPHNQRLTPCNNNLCMQSIDIEQVAALVRERLAAPRARGAAPVLDGPVVRSV
ncbi:glycosyltransferase family 9 protein [Candidatus Binatia bacterium]|nr:glycosyltransferase family 9 protein [Candidatus Binatia bacterium]